MRFLPIKNEVFQDGEAYQTYKLPNESLADWRRRNVNNLIQEIAQAIKDINPRVKFGISPFGVWRNASKDPEGSRTNGGQTNYDDLYADILKWQKEIYFPHYRDYLLIFQSSDSFCATKPVLRRSCLP